MDFNFISDEHFRSSMVGDFEELQSCLNAKSWKAVHVLAGSIVEALLTEYLVVSGSKPNGKDPLKMTLDEIVQACTSAQVLQKSTASLCDVIREYRNLIHPGRMIRLSQQPSAEGAIIATNLVSLIAKEVAQKRKATYGPTAEQIVKKLRTDQHSMAVLPQLLSETNAHEKQKLVRSLIPDAYTDEEKDPFSNDLEFMDRLRLAYRQALDMLDSDFQALIASDFAKAVREDSYEKIESYGEAFFLASDIARLSAQDEKIVSGYLRNRLETSTALTKGFMRQAEALGCHVELAEISRFADGIIRLVLRQPDLASDKAIDFAGRVFDAVDEQRKAAMEKRIDTWTSYAKKKEYPAEPQERLLKLSVKWMEIPF